MPLHAYCVVVVAPGVVVAGVELMSLDEPVLPVAPVVPVLPEAPMEVPLPVVLPVVPEALMSVLEEPAVPLVLPAAVVSVEGVAGVVAGVVVLELDEVDVSVAGRSPQADRARAAIRARPAARAMWVDCIRHSLRVVGEEGQQLHGLVFAACR